MSRRAHLRHGTEVEQAIKANTVAQGSAQHALVLDVDRMRRTLGRRLRPVHVFDLHHVDQDWSVAAVEKKGYLMVDAFVPQRLRDLTPSWAIHFR